MRSSCIYWIFSTVFILLSFIGINAQDQDSSYRNNALSFEFGLPFYIEENFTEITVSRYQQLYSLVYERKLYRKGKFNLNGDFGFAVVRNACEVIFCPAIDLSILSGFVFNHHSIRLGFGNTIGHSTAGGYYNIGYQYIFSKMYYVSLDFDQYFLFYSKKYYLPPTDDCEDCYETKYNVIELGGVIVKLGVGIKF